MPEDGETKCHLYSIGVEIGCHLYARLGGDRMTSILERRKWSDVTETTEERMIMWRRSVLTFTPDWHSYFRWGVDWMSLILQKMGRLNVTDIVMKKGRSNVTNIQRRGRSDVTYTPGMGEIRCHLYSRGGGDRKSPIPQIMGWSEFFFTPHMGVIGCHYIPLEREIGCHLYYKYFLAKW